MSVKIRAHKKFEGVYWIDSKLATKNLNPGKSVYRERLIQTNDGEFRVWDHTRSKPAAAILKGLKHFPVWQGCKILYLGVASGTSSSHMSDIIGKDGIIYGVDISDRTLRELLPTAVDRGNIVPILADAQRPEKYSWIEEVDLIYADIATKFQSEILIRNAKMFLKHDGYAMIAVKSRSIDVTAKPKKVYENQRKILQQIFEIIDFVILDPYERDHCYFVLKFKKRKNNSEVK